jgi:hypothetical protein
MEHLLSEDVVLTFKVSPQDRDRLSSKQKMMLKLNGWIRFERHNFRYECILIPQVNTLSKLKYIEIINYRKYIEIISYIVNNKLYRNVYSEVGRLLASCCSLKRKYLEIKNI